MAHLDVASFLLRVAGLLLAALLLGAAARRVGLPPLAGELLAGVLIGPSVLGHAVPGVEETLLGVGTAQFPAIEAVGQLGVLLMLGLTGATTDLRMLRRYRATATRVSLCGLVIPFALGAAVGYGLRHLLSPDGTSPLVTALFIGTAMAVSAIPVIAKTLIDLRLAHRDIGQLILAAGMIDDALAWLLLSVVSALATSSVLGSDIALAVLKVVAVIVAALLLRPLLGVVLRRAAAAGDGTVVAVVVVTVLAAAGATQALGLEAVVGAFAAGLVIGTTPGFTPRRLTSLHTVVLSVFAPLYFTLAGLKIDLGALARPAVLGMAGIVLVTAVVGKAAGALLGARLSHLGPWPSLALAAGMNSRGVVEIVVAGTGLSLGVLTSASYTAIVLMALVTSLMAPPLLRLAAAHIHETDDETARLRRQTTAWQDPEPAEARA